MSAQEPRPGSPPDAGQRGIERRQVLSAAGAGWLALAGSGAVAALATARFMFPNASEEPDPRVAAGPVDSYARMPAGTVDERRKKDGVWLVRLPDRLVALSTACTHLGCILNWIPGERRFACPCHGSGFALDGTNTEGPAPRPMDRFGVSVVDGLVVVDRSRRFLGGKSDQGSFLSL
ncbi:MAG: ubiquinol-cytochrome c reductase iron-sulfur subunit [Phycisphaerae bacterium]|nr:ubiquinol-cytochrome c reductase iron-sulfur subunit [Phycisphaerae bacterium]